MRKIIYSMFYGNRKTKCFLWTLFLLGIAVIVCVVLAIVMSQPLYGGIGFILGLLLLVISQSYSLDTLAREPGKKAGNSKNPGTREKAGQEKKAAAEEEIADDEHAENDFAHYDEKQLKKIMYRYKVRREHKTIIIDNAPDYKIRQCPAFVWREGNNLHFLLLEKEPRKLDIPLSDIRQIGYHKRVKAEPDKDYRPFTHATLVAKVFREHLPSYQETVENGKRSFYKNLYVVGSHMEITNTSAKNLFSILSVPFVIHNDVTKSQRYSEYFKEAYRYSTLCKDLVISKTEFSEKITGLLDEMADADITGSEFVQTLRDMTQYHFATREQAVACSHKRNNNT